MGKKDKDSVPTAGSVPNRDIIQRMNFLYQASVYLSYLSQDCPPACEEDGEKNAAGGSSGVSRRTVTAHDLAKVYTRTMTAVGKKATVKIDPAIKRTICKGCQSVEVPGLTLSIRTKKSKSHGRCVEYRCTSCDRIRRFPAPALKGFDSSNNGNKQGDTSSANVVGNLMENEDASTASVAIAELPKRKERIYPPLPLSARRDVGHIVFRGDERLLSADLEYGDGVYSV
ncbi:hypothetical protein AMATHDRAFT_158121 [Amanita thiersii Skay4041]|uniref:Rpr2-domain-containing protein n=1 Tax=Amanita thiersii Skay4041 TaxID=703135 RepID=A0A2A9NBS8_9AGAR|nr:hypothetical protein AMATHDRAFT_158121 [Amanita thiersii Skay4041]